MNKNPNKKNSDKKKNDKKKKHFTIKLYLMFWIVLTVAFTGAAATQFLSYREYSARKKIVQLELEAEIAKTEELQRQLKNYESDKHIEKVAREQLGLVRPDEIIFYNSGN